MSNHTHETVPTRFVEAKGVRYAYRRFGKPGAVPMLFLEYFNSNMDGWDPAGTNSLAADHEVILFDNAGVGASEGETPYMVGEMTQHCVAFCRALATSLMPHSTKSADARRDTWPPATKTRRAMRPGLANVKSLALTVMAAEMNFLACFFPGTHFHRRELSVGQLRMVCKLKFQRTPKK